MPQFAGVNIGIIGATGNVGRNIAELILQRHIASNEELRLFASSSSAGKIININHHNFMVEDAAKIEFSTCKLYLLATDSDISKQYIPHALEKNAFIIDSSSLHRLDSNTPLIVAPINKHLINIDQNHLFTIANCVASPLAITLTALQKIYPIKRVVITTFQSTSGAGKSSMDELYHETFSKYEKKSYPRKYFKRPIAFNVIPQIDKFLEDGTTYEEFKINREIQKILQADFPINVTAVRVPVFVGHSASLAIEFHQDINFESILTAFSQTPNLRISSDNYTTPVEVVGSDDVYIGRIRRDLSVPYGINLWVCSDNLHRGAATDVVEAAAEIIQQLQRENQP